MGRYIFALILVTLLASNATAVENYKASVKTAEEDRRIHIVGSTAVFPFISCVAEEFARAKRVKTPIVESTGTSAGFKLFCSGKGDQTPDIVVASRKVNDIELELCGINAIGADDILELQLGDDAIVIASSSEFETFDFTKDEIFNALSYYIPQGNFNLVKNYYKSWSQINKNLPEMKIKVYGPLKNTGTFDAIVHTIFLDQCLFKSAFQVNYKDKDLAKVCSLIRDDGVYIEASSDENIVIQKVIKNNDAFGLFSYSFFSRNSGRVKAHRVNGVDANEKTIRSGNYPISRPIYLYIKKQHIKSTPLIKSLLEEAFSDSSVGAYGYLTEIGLISIGEDSLKQTRTTIANLN